MVRDGQTNTTQAEVRFVERTAADARSVLPSVYTRTETEHRKTSVLSAEVVGGIGVVVTGPKAIVEVGISGVVGGLGGTGMVVGGGA